MTLALSLHLSLPGFIISSQQSWVSLCWDCSLDLQLMSWFWEDVVLTLWGTLPFTSYDLLHFSMQGHLEAHSVERPLQVSALHFY